VIQSVCRKATYCVRNSQRRGGAIFTTEMSIHVEQIKEDPPEEDLMYYDADF